ncbi:MAG: D-2-hydroxyacid dehydrogenase [Chromatiales bacterium]|nr:MAG: D-2-hydroxyacid dehydrogenase [Chromatiales bacterium]
MQRKTYVLTALFAAFAMTPGWAQDVVEALGLQAEATPVREDPRWAPEGPIVVRVLSTQQLAVLQAAAGETPLIAVSSPTEALAEIEDATALLGFCSAELLDAAPRLRWLQLYSAGAENCVDLPRIREREVLLTNLQRVSSLTIAEHVMGLTLALTRGLAPHIVAQAQGDWNPGLVPMQQRVELSGRTMLVVGLGGIGTEVARRADAFGMRVIAVRATGQPGPPFVAEVAKPDRLLQMAAQADVVVNSVPLTADTAGMFDAAVFAAMPPSAYFINVGRGRSVVTDDLVAALRDGQIAGTAFDVTDPEPLPADHPLWTMPNVIITPHVSAQSDRIFERVLAVVAENLRRYVAGEAMLSVVDPEAGY